MSGDEQQHSTESDELGVEISRLFFELPFIGMAVTSPNNKRWLRVNQTLCDMLGYTREELLAKTWSELTHPEDRSRDVAQFESIMRGASDGHKQNKRYFRRDGAIVHTVIDVKAVRRADGAVKFFVATIADVTAQVKAEVAAKRSTALMTKLARQVPGALYQLHRFSDGRICFPFASEGLEEVYEVCWEDVRLDAGAILERIDDADRGHFLQSLEECAHTLSPWQCDYRVNLPQLGLRWLRSEARPESLPDGDTLWHGITTDITDRQLQQLAAEESKERLRLQMEYAPDAILTFDPGLNCFVDANPQAASMFEMPREQLLQLSWRDLSPSVQPGGSVPSEVGHEWVRRAHAGESVTFQWVFQLRSGSTFSGEVRLNQMPHHGVQLVRVSITDISARLEKEKLLRTSEERLMQAIRCTQAGIFDHDHIHGTVYWSPELYRIYDVEPSIPGSLAILNQRLHPDDREAVAAGLAKAGDPQNEGRFDGQHRIIWRNGEVRRLSARSQTLFTTVDGARVRSRTIGAITDVTDAWRAQETLLTLQTAVESSLSIVAMANLEGKLTYANRAFLDLWGYKDAAEVLGRHVSSFWRSQSEGAKVFNAVLETGMWLGERTAQRSDGTERTLQISVSLFRDSEGNPAGMLGSFVDITDSKNLQAQLLHAQKMESIGMLAGGIAHDFNNLLTIIRGYVDLAQLNLADGVSVTAELSEIERASDLAVELTQQLLAFSRRQIIDPVTLNLNEVVHRAHGMLKRVLGEDIRLNAQTARDLWLVSFDPGQAEQILLNLAVNARDAMPDGGCLTLETSNVVLDEEYAQSHPGVRAGDFVMLAVSDTGEGMDAKTLAHAFEPFYTTKGLGHGTGLGLAVIHGAVSQNGGRIELYSEPGHGTSFKIYLPRADGEQANLATMPRPQAPSGAEHILLVEDDDSVRQLAIRMLESFGYCVHSFAEPAEAINWLKGGSHAIDVLVTDVIMPGMNGKELAEEVVALRPKTKILFVSGYTANVIVHHGVLKPGVEFLAKPYSREGLARRLREVLDS